MDTTNEPVAWMNPETLECGHGGNVDWEDTGCIPLYTHPVNPKYDPETGEPLIDGYPLFSGLPHPVKELTDEEITEIVADKYEKGHGRYIDTYLFFIEFARAILRKAQGD